MNRRPFQYLFLTGPVFGLLLSLLVMGQGPSRYLKTYGSTLSEYANSVCKDGEKGFILAGIAGTRYNDIPLSLVHASCDGSMDWQNFYMVDTVNVPGKIRRAADGSYFVFFTAWSTDFNSGYTALLRTDEAGQPIWAKKISSTANDKAIDIRVLNNRIYLLSTGHYNIWYPTALITCLDTAGNYLWSQEYAAPFNFDPQSLAIRPDGTMGIAVTQNSFGTGTPSFSNVTLLLLDANGAILHANSIGSYYDDEVYGIDSYINGWVLCGRTANINTGWDAALHFFSVHGNYVRSRLLDGGGSIGEVYRDVVSLSDGSIAATGDNGAFEERNIMLSRINLDATMRWTKEYPVSPLFTNYAFQVLEAQDGGLALTGDMRPPGWYRDLFLLKTDDAGEIPCYSAPFLLQEVNETFEDITATITVSQPNTQVTSIPVSLPSRSFFSHVICEEIVPETAVRTAPDTGCPLNCVRYEEASCPAGVAWYWEFPGGTPATSTLQSPPTVCYPQPGNYKVWLTVTTPSGQTYTGIHDVTVDDNCSEWKIPNIITPNNDGKNDEFKITGLPDEFELVIYNRWGKKIFSSDSPTKLWNGRTEENHPVDDGVYFYTLRAFTGKHEGSYSGTITVLRDS